MGPFTSKLDGAVEALTFDDVLIKPAASRVEPSEADVSSRVTTGISINVPVLSAAMDTVTQARMAIAMAEEGGLGVLHRNLPAEKQAEMVREVKEAAEFVVKDVVSVTPDASVETAWDLLQSEGISGAPVVERPDEEPGSEGGRVVGVVSRRDLAPRVKRGGGGDVRDVMTEDVITVGTDVSKEEAVDLMYGNRIERLPIVGDDGGLKGIVTLGDIQDRESLVDASLDGDGKLLAAAAVGPFDQERARLLDEAGADVLFVDCAHGHNMNVVESAESIIEDVEADVVVGNIATAQGAKDLVSIGVDGIKVGVGPGSICTTRVVTGVGVPQVTAISSVADVASKHDVPVIADGGIRYSGDIAKAFASGADAVMLGGVLAGTKETPGRIVSRNGRRYKEYRGMGSMGAMTGGFGSDRYLRDEDGGGEIGSTKFVPEGIEGVTPYKGPLHETLYQLVGGVKSSMGYTGAATIEEMKQETELFKITASGQQESHPHDVTITDEAPNYPMNE